MTMECTVCIDSGEENMNAAEGQNQEKFKCSSGTSSDKMSGENVTISRDDDPKNQYATRKPFNKDSFCCPCCANVLIDTNLCHAAPADGSASYTNNQFKKGDTLQKLTINYYARQNCHKTRQCGNIFIAFLLTICAILSVINQPLIAPPEFTFVYLFIGGSPTLDFNRNHSSEHNSDDGEFDSEREVITRKKKPKEKRIIFAVKDLSKAESKTSSNREYAKNLLHLTPDTKNILFNNSNTFQQQNVLLYPTFSSLTSYMNRVQSEGNLSQEERMSYEVMRLLSFNSVPVQTSAIRLAQTGFYATGNRDEARCYSCGTTHRNWQLMDHPDAIHRQASPNCPHLNGEGNRNIAMSSDDHVSTVFGIVGEYSHPSTIPEQPQSSEEASNVPDAHASLPASEIFSTPLGASLLSPLDGLDIAEAVYPQYRDYTARLDSYRDWQWSDIQDPSVLSRAGFYFAGYRDCCRCFYCGIGLRTWERSDDPWVEHARWRSSCGYLRQMRDNRFIMESLARSNTDDLTASIQSGTSRLGATNILTNQSGDSNTLTNQNASTQTLTNHQNRTGNDIATVGLDESTVISRALEMGFSSGDIDRAMEELRGRESHSKPVAIQLSTLLEKLVLIDEQQTQLQENATNMSTSPLHNSDVQPETSVEPRHFDSLTSLSSTTNQKTANLPRAESMTNASLESTRVQSNNTEGSESGCLSANQERQLEEENQSLRDESTCKICMDNPSCIVFLPCGHLVTCAECAPALRKCPICREVIRGTVRAHTVSRRRDGYS